LQRAPSVQDTEGFISRDSYYFFVESSGRFVEVDGVLAGFMAFSKIEQARTIQLQHLQLNFLNPAGLLKLKISSWANKSRRSGLKRDGDIIDIDSIQDLLIQNGEKMPLKGLEGDAANGLWDWIQEFKDLKMWQLLDSSYKGH